MNNELLAQADPEISAAINDELTRQRNTLELIASENIPSLPVIETMGTILTNKYAEGYPGKRYYGGCANVDTIETIARNRACRGVRCGIRQRPAAFGRLRQLGSLFCAA